MALEPPAAALPTVLVAAAGGRADALIRSERWSLA
jgi:hypothetical protein